MTASRRNVIGGGLTMLALGGGARAEEGVVRRLPPDTTPRAAALDTPALSGNLLAKSFKEPPADLVVPRVKIERASGLRDLKPEPGLTLLSLWAPWCAPCLRELKDLAAQQRAFGGKRFRILAVLTAPRDEITVAEARALMDKVEAQGLEAVIDRSPGGRQLFETLSGRDTPNGRRNGLPCNLLFDGEGRVLARQFGTPLKFDGPPPADGKPAAEAMAKASTLWVAAEGKVLFGALQRGEIAGGRARPLVS